MLANPGESYLCYLPTGGSVNISVGGGEASYSVAWINARNPLGDQRDGGTTLDGRSLAAPDSQDWLVYLTRVGGGSGPEAQVTGNGAGIASGDTSPSSTDGTDFGFVDPDGGSATRSFTIANVGSETLTVGPVGVSGTHAADFTVTIQPGSSVAAGDSTTFVVSFDPNGEGLRTATLTFDNNDSDENPYSFAIMGTGGTGGGAIVLYHFEEAGGASDPGNPIVNYGTAGAALNLTNTGGPDGRDNTGGGGYGATGHADYGTAFDILASGNNVYHTTTSSTGGGLLTSAAVAQSALQGPDGAFTYEALISVANTTGEQDILSHDGTDARGFLFRINNGTLSLYAGTTSHTAPIPTTGTHQFTANVWYHVAVVYNGRAGATDNLRLYWTAMDGGAMAANLIGTATMTADLDGAVSNFLGVGTTTRSQFRFELAGLVDEVALHGIAVASDGFDIFATSGTPGITDTSGDGIPDTWAIAHGFDPAQVIAQDDPDSDGISNLMEFALNLDPRVCDPGGLPTIEPVDGHLVMSINRNADATRLLFIVELSSDLTTWYSGSEYATVIEDSSTRLVAMDNQPIDGFSRRFMRLRVDTSAK